MLGSLPLIADFARRLRIAAVIDELCPSRGNAHLTHGQVAQAIIANRLTQPRALYHLLTWARKWAVGETFGFDAERLNDDRLARCLDALAPQIDAIQGGILVHAVREFDLDLSQLHWDLTSVVLESTADAATAPSPAPEGAAPAYPQPAYGYGGIPDQLQLRVGELVTSDGGVPIFHRSFDGNRADVGTVVATMAAVRTHVPLPDCLVIGDSKLLSADVLHKLRRQGLHFLAPLPKNPALDAEFLGLPAEGWQELAYCSGREARLPPEARTRYVGQEVPWTWTNPETGETETFRRLYVISSEERDTCRKVRLRKLTQAGAELNALLEKLGTGRLQTKEQVQTRATRILEKRGVQAFVRVTVRLEGGKPLLHWEVVEAALRAAERLDGYYVLLSSWPTARADASTLLRRWKQEWQVERRFHDWKGPLQVRPVFVSTPARLAALLLLLHLALVIFSLLEREVRRILARQGETKVRNLLAGHVDAVPTGANLLLAFDHWFLITEETSAGYRRAVSELEPVPHQLWHLLGAQLPAWA